MTRETPREAILRHTARGMRRSQIEAIYGKDRVLALLGSEKPPEMKLPPAPVTFADRLVAARNSYGITQTALAKLLVVPLRDVEAMEAGQSIPLAPRRVILLAGFMKAGADELAAELGVDLGPIQKQYGKQRAA